MLANITIVVLALFLLITAFLAGASSFVASEHPDNPNYPRAAVFAGASVVLSVLWTVAIIVVAMW